MKPLPQICGGIFLLLPPCRRYSAVQYCSNKRRRPKSFATRFLTNLPDGGEGGHFRSIWPEGAVICTTYSAWEKSTKPLLSCYSNNFIMVYLSRGQSMTNVLQYMYTKIKMRANMGQFFCHYLKLPTHLRPTRTLGLPRRPPLPTPRTASSSPWPSPSA